MENIKKIEGYFLKNSDGKFLTAMFGDSIYYSFLDKEEIELENIQIFLDLEGIERMKKQNETFFDKSTETDISINDLTPVKPQ